MRHPQNSATTWSDVISQDDLVEYHELKTQRDLLDKEVSERRQAIIQRIQAGAPVEPGAFRAAVRYVDMKLFSSEKLEKAIGTAAVNDLKQRIESTHRVELRITKGA
jgi:hypothetical protein